MKASTFTGLLDKLRLRKANYQRTFGPGAPLFGAMADLANFCRPFGNDVVIGDHDRTLVLAGRREVFWRIYAHLNLQPDELAELYKANVRGEEA